MVLAPQSSSLQKLWLKPGRWTVGSAATCSYRIVADGVRPRHALLLCGGQKTLLKAWDSDTWHNGQRVSGEVRLQTGDRVTVGSVEFSVEDEPQTQASPNSGWDEVRTTHQPTQRLPVLKSEELDLHQTSPEQDGSDLERLRDQIQSLRDELSQRASRRTAAIAVQPPPLGITHPEIERLTARVHELEQSADEARQLTKQTQQQLSDLRAEQHQREIEWQQAREQLLAERSERELDWRQKADEWAVEHEELQNELRSISNARNELATRLDQRHSEQQAELTRWKTECEELRADRQQQAVAEAAQREQWQQELTSLSTARQQFELETERRQSELQNSVTLWQTTCQTLRADLQRQQATWEDELARLQAELLRREEETARQIQQVTTQHTQESTEQSMQLLAERQRIEAERAQIELDRLELQAARQETEQSLTRLSAERQLLESQAAEVEAKAEDQVRRTADIEQQLAQIARDQQVVEHSRNWVQSDRRKLVEEKTQWQQQCADQQAKLNHLESEREQLRLQLEELEQALGRLREETQQLALGRDQFSSEREQFVTERADWNRQREQLESERRAQPLTVPEEIEPLQSLRHDWDARAVEVQIERQAAELKPNSFSETSSSWDTDSPTVGDQTPAHIPRPTLSDEAQPSLTTDWSIGVDLTAPREMPVAEQLVEPAVSDDWPATSETGPLTTEVTEDEVRQNEDSDGGWENTSQVNELHANVETSQASVSDPPPARTTELRSSAMETLDAQVAALRAELAAKFQLPALRESLPETEVLNEPIEEEPSPTEMVAAERTAAEETVAETVSEPVTELAAEPATEPATKTTIEPATSPNNASPVSALGELAFDENESVDDSVSRYMQNLLARSQKAGENSTDRFVPPSVPMPSGAVPAQPPVASSPVVSPIRVSEVEVADGSESSGTESTSSDKLQALKSEPAHKQDKEAIRAATERMRQVANQQTLNVVQASNSLRIRRSVKTKSCLATFSFVLSSGLLFLGYTSQPDFLVLGICAAGLGVMTWVDLFIAIRDARRRTMQLAGRKKTE
jgi:hypothetical protein